MSTSDFLSVHGLNQNNLKNLSFRIPKNKIVVFTGVSGSGKSSIVFDTLAAESQRQFAETYPSHIRRNLPAFEKPDVQQIDHLVPSVVIDQSRLGFNARSTVGTATDILGALRALFSRFGLPHVGGPSHFSFNDPAGMCMACAGLGRVAEPNLDVVLDPAKSLHGGMILLPSFEPGKWYWKQYVQSGLFDPDKPLSDYSERERNILLYGTETRDGKRLCDKVEGLYNQLRRLLIDRDSPSMQERKNLPPDLVRYDPCPVCHGGRLNWDALNCHLLGYNLADLCRMEITTLRRVLQDFDEPSARPLLERILGALDRIIDIGMPYLSLDREVSTLSGGEAQRLKLVRFLGSSITGLMYVFDEPSTGLHPRDVCRMTRLLQNLRDHGNTVLVVEHDKDVIQMADEVVDVGPCAGIHGGQIVFQGPYPALLRSGTVTGNALLKHVGLKDSPRKPTGFLPVRDACIHNLKHASADFPTGVLTVVTGVAGSGKSSLVREVFAKKYADRTVVIDQTSITATVRSSPATFLGIWNEIRNLLARENGVDPAMFSYNSDGACPVCKGHGVIHTELAFMDPVTTVCETCGGKRYNDQALSYRYRGRNVLELLSMTAEEALSYFAGTAKITHPLETMARVGLGYLTLGQPLSTLSGGERQRLKLARNLKARGSCFVFDEPTTGLHPADVEKIVALFDDLVDSGNTVVVIEHNLDVMKRADYLIDIGPDGGSDGGEVVFAGTPAEMVRTSNTITAQFLRKSLGGVSAVDGLTQPDFQAFRPSDLQHPISPSPAPAFPMGLKAIGRVSLKGGETRILVAPEYRKALAGLEGFGAAQVVWWFSGCDNERDRSCLVQEKPYTKGPSELGTFATRAPQRPNPVAVSAVDITRVDAKRGVIGLSYLDAFEGTPVLDIKPYTPSLDRIEKPVVPEWCRHWPKSTEANDGFDWEAEFNF